MIEDTKWPKNLEAKAGGKTGTYWVVTWQDGKTDKLFNPKWRDICEEAIAKQLAIHFTKEKQGNFWNITSLDFASEALGELQPQQPVQPPPQLDEPTVVPDSPPQPAKKLQISDTDKLKQIASIHTMMFSYAKDQQIELLKLGHIKAGELDIATIGMAEKYVNWAKDALKKWL